jgi:hypothetical protein
MADIFLSYSKREREQPESLARYLESQGFSVWWDMGLLPTDNYRDEIDRQLDQAQAVIVIWTADSIASKWVRAEADHADHSGKLINTHAAGLDPRRIPKPFNQVHSVDLGNRADIAGAVRKLIGKHTVVGDAFPGKPRRWHQTLSMWLQASSLPRMKYIVLALILLSLFPAKQMLSRWTTGLMDVRPGRQVDPRVAQLGRDIRDQFRKQRRNLEASMPADFVDAKKLLATLEIVDGKSGHVPYFTEEILRVETPTLFSPQSCVVLSAGRTDGDLKPYRHNFELYLERAPPLRAEDDPGSDACYTEASDGFCRQRTAWIHHLLANDFYAEALASTDTDQRRGKLELARLHAVEARDYRHDNRDGFEQCVDTVTLLDKIGNTLSAEAQP